MVLRNSIRSLVEEVVEDLLRERLVFDESARLTRHYEFVSGLAIADCIARAGIGILYNADHFELALGRRIRGLAINGTSDDDAILQLEFVGVCGLLAAHVFPVRVPGPGFFFSARSSNRTLI